MSPQTKLSKEKLLWQRKKKSKKRNYSLFPTGLLLVTDTVTEGSDGVLTRHAAEGIFEYSPL